MSEITLRNTESGDTYEIEGLIVRERESDEQVEMTAGQIEMDEWEVVIQ